MKTNKELLAIAKSQIGNNGGKYRKYVGEGGSWCDMFVYWLYNANGCGSLLNWTTKAQKINCPSSMKWCEKNLAQIPPYLAMACDPIYFDWDGNGNPNHIGIVEKHCTTNKIYTIEGNTSGGKVDDKFRKGYIQAVFRPHFPHTFSDKILAIDGDFGYQSIGGMQKALKVLGYYNGKIDCILGKETVKALQRLVGCKDDGAWGATTSGKTQQYLKSKGYYAGKVDKAFGEQSVVAMQKWINANAFQSKPVENVKKNYDGEFPNLVTHSGQKIAYTARDLAWKKGTKKAIYTYPKGRATDAFKKALNKVYPNRKSWGAKPKVGASCDVGAGTIIRYSGYDTKVPRGLEEQLTHFKNSKLWAKTGQKKCTLAGDVAMHPSPSAHIWIGLGDGNLAEANYHWAFFEHIVKDTRKINNKAKAGVYRACYPTPIRKGDRGTEVTKLQNFLNWAGFNCGKADGVFGENTLKAVEAFQAKVGLKADGVFGKDSLAKAVAYSL